MSRRLTKHERDRITKRNQIESPFLRLAAELRNKIYSLALDTTTVFIGDGHFRRMNRDDLHLPQVCRQIHHETHPFLESYTTLCLAGSWQWDPYEIRSLLARKGHSFSAVRELQLDPVRAHMFRERQRGPYNEPVEDDKAYCADLPRIFPSLQRLVLGLEVVHVDWLIDVTNSWHPGKNRSFEK